MKACFDRLRECRDELRGPVSDCVQQANTRGRRQWFCARIAIAPYDVLPDFVRANTRDAFFWQEPSRGVSLLGVGRVATISAIGPKRFGEASTKVRELFEDLQVHDLDRHANSRRNKIVEPVSSANCADHRGPLLHGGFAFYDGPVPLGSEWEGLGSGRLVLPELGVVVRDGKGFASRTCAIDPGDCVELVLDRLCAEPAREDDSARNSDAGQALAVALDVLGERTLRGPEIRVQADRPHARYLGQVEAALSAIDAGEFEKVVLARSLEVHADRPFDVSTFLTSLREIYPSCATLSVRQDGAWFVSATPERLAALTGSLVTTAAVAGSAPRGRSHDEEALYSARLLQSEKERFEHEIVKRSICEALADACGSLEGPDVPRLLKLEGIQHLETPLQGRLLSKWRGALGVLDLVGALHPTPAVGGAPSASALKWLEQHEALDRGWYAGPVGYLDAKGDGEFRVALRSTLLGQSRARLFAGAGVVAGSKPERELAETRLKLRALLAPLTEI